MKKLLSLALMLSVLMACNNDKKADKTDTETTTTNANTTTSTGWDGEMRKKNEDQCIEGSKAGMGDEKAKAYCDCMMDKLEARYPVADSLSNMTVAQLQSKMNELAQDCPQ